MTTDERIRKFATLEHGWFFGEGDKIRPETTKVTRTMNRLYEGMGMTTNAFPLSNGGLLLMLYQFVHEPFQTMEIEIYGGSWNIVYEALDEY